MKNTTKEVTHTPTPWKVGYDKTFSPACWDVGFNSIENGEQAGVGYAQVSARCYKEADAAFIVRAVNSHEALLKIAKRLSQMMPDNDGLGGHAPINAFIALTYEARNAIALSEGE